MSWTTRLTNGSVRLASDNVKNLWGNDDPWHFLRMGDEADDLLRSVNHHNGRSHVMIRRIELLRQFVPLELRVGLHDRSVGPSVILHRTVTWIVAQPHAPRHDIPIRDRAEIVSVFRIVDHRADGDVLSANTCGYPG